MRIDTHTHLILTKVSGIDWDHVAQALKGAAAADLDIVYVSEHVDAVGYEELLRGLFEQGRMGGELLAPGVVKLDDGPILRAAGEVPCRNGEDIGVHTDIDVLFELHRAKGHYTVSELLDQLDATSRPYAAIVHHVYWPTKYSDDIAENASRLHAIELPSRHLDEEERYHKLAADLGLPLVGGSDAHSFIQYGACFSEVKEMLDVDEAVGAATWLLRALQAGTIEARKTPSATRLMNLGYAHRHFLMDKLESVA